MSNETNRIPVPTNGKGPHPTQEPGSVPEDAESPATTAVFTPTQLAVGFGIIASLILLLVGRIRRRGRTGSRGRFGRH